MQPTQEFTEAKQPPAQIGRYRVLGRIGSGGMGTVYKALDPELNRVVAVKLPRFDGPPEILSARQQRFQREARAAAAVAHPNVCPIYDVGEQDGQPFVVMAYVEGESLGDLLARQGRFDDPHRAVALIGQILDALEAVHGHGIVHRDLKPGNILIDSAGRALLTDFGLARHQEDAEPLTSEGVVIGTPAYMPPEQAAGQINKIGPWTDLYSVGAILFQMLTGRVPFEGPALTVLGRIMNETPPLLSSRRPDLDSVIEGIVLQAMTREIGNRFQTAGQFREMLNLWTSIPAAPAVQKGRFEAAPRSPRSAETLTAPTPAVKTPKSSPAFKMGKWVRKKLRIAIAIIAALFVVAFVARQVKQSDLEYPENPHVSWENYIKIKEGMTKMEVEDILGTSGVFNREVTLVKDENGGLVDLRGGGKGGVFVGYGQELRWNSANRKAIYVIFLNGKVTGKTTEGLYKKM